MTIMGGIDIHRAQLTDDYVDLATGEFHTGRVAPANRDQLRAWLERFDGLEEVAFALEGCTGWRYVVEELVRAGVTAHVAEPAETAALRGRKSRAKTDRADARHLRQLLTDGRVPESWIPPVEVLDARVLVRLYKDLVDERTGWLQRVHATLFHHGVPAVGGSLVTKAGRELLASADLPAAGRYRSTLGCAKSSGSPTRCSLCVGRSLLSAPISRVAKRCSVTTGSGRCCPLPSGRSSATAAGSPAPTMPSAVPVST